ncbi:MAG: lipoyl synthase [Candidatus Omnitrophica bacterium]|nr:lipoyl synthase [Candidatus Omnitrophota bacterium]
MIPEYIKKRISYCEKDYEIFKNFLESHSVNTVCKNANCPNIYECFRKNYASFMILGSICTRNCKFCSVNKGKPQPLDEKEPKKIAEVVKKFKMKYVVITSVTRDDLPDGGALQFKKTVEEIKKISPQTKIELLIPDFKGDISILNIIFNSQPDVISHNIETVKSLYPIIRPKANYETSLQILFEIKKAGFTTKSGFMIGLGETENEIYEIMNDILKTGCDILVIGQYLKSSKNGYEVKKFYTEEFFKKLENYGLQIGFKKIYAGIFYRTSYLADTFCQNYFD